MVKNLMMLGVVLFAVAMAYPPTRIQMEAALVQPVKDEIGRRLVPRRIRVMADQLDMRLSRAQGLPTGFEGWLRRDYSGVEHDPWGNVYFLQTSRRNYTVGSMGPDGVQGTEDDITVTRQLPRRR